MAPGPVHGAKLICKRVLTCLEYLNQEIRDSEECLKGKSYGFGPVL